MHYIIIGLWLACVLLVSTPTLAEEKEKQPVSFSADTLQYNKNTGEVIADGEVEATQGNKTLYSDHLTYNQNTNIVNAEGNVVLKEKSGDTFYADDATFSNDMNDGVIHSFEARLADKSLLQAQKATRKEGIHIRMKKARYTPCPICKNSKIISPVWQIRARNAHLDDEAETMSYQHAFFDVYGVPVLYTPYLSHPSPNAKRKSGFLIPSYGSDNLLGYMVTTPYYVNIAPDKDATFIPTYTSDAGMIYQGKYRQLTQNGSFNFHGSITRPDELDNRGRATGKKDTRSHIEGKGNFNINDLWKWGFTANRASDDTYMRRYHFGNKDTLTSRAYAERIENRNYTVVQTLAFQGLNRNDDPSQTPFLLPYTQTHYESAPGFKGSRWTVDTDALVLTRTEGMQSRRIATKTGWQLPHISRSGHVFMLKTNVRGDLYSLDQRHKNPATPEIESSFEDRLVPQMELDWSFPMVREGGNHRIFFEPVVNLIASPRGGNPDAIPNEDSQVVELSDINLFSDNRFAGVDRVETGSRANYGLRGGVHGNNGQHVDFIFGQTYRTEEDGNLAEFSGLSDNASDYVGRVSFMTSEMFNLGYRFRLNRDDLSPKRNEYMAGVAIDPVRFDVNYMSLNAGSSTLSTIDREEVSGRIFWDVNERWALSTTARRDLASDQFISSGANLLYKGDCATLALSWLRQFTRDRDIEPTSLITFQILLKNLN